MIRCCARVRKTVSRSGAGVVLRTELINALRSVDPDGHRAGSGDLIKVGVPELVTCTETVSVIAISPRFRDEFFGYCVRQNVEEFGFLQRVRDLDPCGHIDVISEEVSRLGCDIDVA